MNNLTTFVKITLAVLKKLQYLCDSTASYKPDTKKGIEYSFKDMYPPLVGEEQLQDVVQYLSENGLKISITFPVYNSDPREFMYQKKYGDPGNVPLGLIKGKSIEEIKEVIQKNINKLSSETQSLKEINENSKVKKLKPKFTSIKIDNDSVYFGGDKIPAKMGQNGMAKLFIKNAKEYRGNKEIKKGKPLKKDEFKHAGNYSNNNSFRFGLSNLKGKMKDKKWPIGIKAVGGGLYQMEIYYDKK